MIPANPQAQSQPSHAPELRAAARHLGRRRFLTSPAPPPRSPSP